MALPLSLWAHKLLTIAACPVVFFNTVVIALGCVLIIGVGYGSLCVLCYAFGFRPRIISEIICRTSLSLFCLHMEHFGGLRVQHFGTPVKCGERAIVVCNHRSWVDTSVLVSMSRFSGVLGNLRFVADKQILHLPIFGVLAGLLDAVFIIERKASIALAPLSRAYSRLRREYYPFWLVVYAEGFLRSDKKLAESRKFAQERGLVPLKHLLQPRTKGFVIALSALRHEIDCVYDVTIAYGDKPYAPAVPTFGELYISPARKPRTVNVHTRRIPIDQVPSDEEEAKKWLYALYEEKDQRLEKFYAEKKFEGNRVKWEPISLVNGFAHVIFSIVVLAVFIGACFLVIAKIRNPTERVLPSFMA